MMTYMKKTMIVALMALWFASAFVVSACGDNAPQSVAPDAAVDTYPSCQSLRPACAEPQNLSRICAETGECYCDVGTKTAPMPIRCSLDMAAGLPSCPSVGCSNSQLLPCKRDGECTCTNAQGDVNTCQRTP